MKVNNFIKVSTVDYPGVLATVVFTQGCNLRCPYCYKSELMVPSPGYNDTSVREEFFDYLEKRKDMIEVVVISGGEPLYQEQQYVDIYAKEMVRFCKKIKEIGNFKIKLDTNGTYPDQLMGVINSGCLDYIAMDIKTDIGAYNLHGLTNRYVHLQILLSISTIVDSGIDHEFRTTCASPIVHPEDFHKIGRRTRKAKRYYLQNYRQIDTVANPKNLRAFTEEELIESKEILQQYIQNVEIRGLSK